MNKTSLILNKIFSTSKVILTLAVFPFVISCNTAITLPEIYQQNPEIYEQSRISAVAVAENGIFFGDVTEILPDDNDGIKHQRFMLRVNQGRYNNEIFLVAHNTTLAPYVPIQVGSALEIKGDLLISENPKVLHWTHHDPAQKHIDGYIKFQNQYFR